MIWSRRSSCSRPIPRRVVRETTSRLGLRALVRPHVVLFYVLDIEAVHIVRALDPRQDVERAEF